MCTFIHPSSIDSPVTAFGYFPLPCSIRSFGLESETTTDDPYLVLRRILIPILPLVPSDLLPLLLHLPEPAGLANGC
ncbi:hypothetical protein V8C44DRAFT_323892 [Trichoderma aethiopicum]